jgi:3-methyladenine DNA glycosylase AlkD
MPSLSQFKKELKELSDLRQAKILQRFFKTGKGEYGEGDIFLGVKVPVQRKIAAKFYGLSLKNIEKMLESKIHEHRMTALFILINKYEKGGEQEKKIIFNFYLKNIRNINNWDLVDFSAPKIIGDYLTKKINEDRKKLNKNNKILIENNDALEEGEVVSLRLLYKLAKSNNLWKRRIAIISTLVFIKNNRFNETLKISKILIADKRDLIHKAVGWMLREIGKRDQKIEEKFLKKYYLKMPRTMLRYAIERFGEDKRKFYLAPP